MTLPPRLPFVIDTSQPIRLIENPKSRRDWENNKLYYRNKGFSKTQLERIEKNNKIALNAQQVIAARSNGGGCNPLDGGCSNRTKRKKPQQHVPFLPPIDSSPLPIPPPTQVVNDNDNDNDIEQVKTRILNFTTNILNDWDDCDEDDI
jgi:hypothetical protein